MSGFVEASGLFRAMDCSGLWFSYGVEDPD